MGQHQAKKLSNTDVRMLKKQVSFSESEIQDWYDEFRQSTNRKRESLFLSEEEFVNVYNSVYPGKGDDFAKHVFRTFDIDSDGRVDFREFLIGMSFSGSSDFDKKLRWAFQVYDVDGDGFISQDEMRMIFKAVFKMIGPLVMDGVIQDPVQMADEIFFEMDTNGDNQISWDEFRVGATKHPTVVRLLECSPPEQEPE